jgi:hypothetical protein
MIDRDEKGEAYEAARAIADEISEFRKEFVANAAGKIIEEIEELAEQDFDPARGRGRGPLWVDGEK